MRRIEKEGDIFKVTFDYDPALVSEVKRIPWRRWNPDQKFWSVPMDQADTLKVFAEVNGFSFSEDLPEAAEKKKAVLESSRAIDANVEFPAPDGNEYLPFQKAGIKYALERNDVLIGDEMGLGKTIQAIGVVNADESIKRILIICPATLKINWKRELEKWLVRKLSIEIINNGSSFDSDVAIINYDLLGKYHEELRARTWDLLIVDECHYVKNPKAQRTQEIFGRWDRDPEKVTTAISAKRRIFMTGTPILNRPIELWPILRSTGLFKSWKYYVKKYCAAYYNRYGWDVSGSSNLSELQDYLRTKLMVRRLKKDVLSELPDKRRQVVELPATGCEDVIDAENESWADYEERLEDARAAVELAKAGEVDEYEQAVAKLREISSVAFTEISALRHETALAKIPTVVEHINGVLEETDKVVVFAHHHDVIERLRESFPDMSVTLTGEDSMEERQHAVDSFQNDLQVRIFIGSIKAAGVGITLTAASHVVFAELDWVPGNVTQAEDRLHRIGQRGCVLVQHLVLDGSLDVKFAKTLVEKQSVIDEALDREERAEFVNVPVVPAAGGIAVGRSSIERESKKLSDEDISVIHRGIQMLAGVCDGAVMLDGVGYNKVDSRIGHELASKPSLTKKQAALAKMILRKYHRQLPQEVVNIVKDSNK